ncbi:MAG: enoyl-CoA hydratase/isomerase family protein [Candidatus Binatia bacterium]|nr:enoyl-CoA hydratase/isomerase family protein [Candidatus Binatia bacterium]
MSYETLTLEKQGKVARVWLNRPERRNALSGRALEEIRAVFEELQTSFETSVVVLAGRGLSFCAGADRKDPPGRSAAPTGLERERRYMAQMGKRAVEAIERCEAITIARLQGHAIGGGVLLAAACDFRIAARSTIFHVPEVDLGIPLTWGGAPRLAHLVGPARAKEIILLCDRFDAEAADRFGLLNRVVDDDALDDAVQDWVARLAAKPEWALHMSKTQFRGYDMLATLGDLTEGDADLLNTASAKDPTRFAFPAKD